MREGSPLSVFDYVIVGAGSAGCVLASRLSEDPDVKVLLLEAGPPDVNQNIHVPLGYLQLGSTEVDWDYHSGPERECSGRRIPLPRGRVLGGSSSINAMVYIRGNHRDYDEWGVPGWSWADMMPYFLKAEDNERGASDWHGAGGPLPVSEGRLRQCHLQGLRRRRRAGRSSPQRRLQRRRAGRRRALPGDPARRHAREHGGSYLHPAMERSNLTVLPYMLALGLLFEGITRRRRPREPARRGQGVPRRARGDPLRRAPTTRRSS